MAESAENELKTDKSLLKNCSQDKKVSQEYLKPSKSSESTYQGEKQALQKMELEMRKMTAEMDSLRLINFELAHNNAEKKAKDQKLQALQNENEELFNALASLQLEVSSKNDEKYELIKKEGALTRTIQELQKQIDSLTKEKSALDSKNQEFSKKIESYAFIQNKMMREMKDQEQKEAELKEQIRYLCKRRPENEDDGVLTMNKRLRRAQEQINTQEEILTEILAHQDYNAIKEENELLRIEISKIEENSKSAKEDLEAALVALRTMGQKYSAQQEKIKKMLEKIKSLNGEFEEYEDEEDMEEDEMVREIENVLEKGKEIEKEMGTASPDDGWSFVNLSDGETSRNNSETGKIEALNLSEESEDETDDEKDKKKKQNGNEDKKEEEDDDWTSF